MKDIQACFISGYTPARLQQLRTDPAFDDLVAVYRNAAYEEFLDYQSLAMGNMVKAESTLSDALDAVNDRPTPPELGEIRPLLEVISDRADRFGFPKKTVQANINLDLAGRLESARKRSRLDEEPADE